MASGIGSGPGSAGSAGGSSTATSSPALTWWLGSRIVRPLTVTCPARIRAFRRERDSSSKWAASARSSRSPACAAAITVSTLVATSLMTDPIADDEPLSPAQAQIVARVRWLMVLSGVATFLGIAVVISVIGYRVFRSDGRAGPAEAVALLPKGGRVVQTAVAGDRIVVTIDVGGTLEIRTFDAATLRPAGR